MKFAIDWLHQESDTVNSVTCGIDQKPKLILLTDSHGQGLAKPLSSALPEVSVHPIVKPNATFSEIINEILSGNESSKLKDIVVIKAGTNHYRLGKTKENLKKEFDVC